jgi:hypothetical protein
VKTPFGDKEVPVSKSQQALEQMLSGSSSGYASTTAVFPKSLSQAAPKKKFPTDDQGNSISWKQYKAFLDATPPDPWPTTTYVVPVATPVDETIISHSDEEELE